MLKMQKAGKCVYHLSPITDQYAVWYLEHGRRSLLGARRLVTGLSLDTAAALAQGATYAIRRAPSVTLPEYVAADYISSKLKEKVNADGKPEDER